MKTAGSDEGKLIFPVHHKHQHDNDFFSSQHIDSIDSLDIGQVTQRSYITAIDMINFVGISSVLLKRHMFDIERTSTNVFNHLNRTRRIFDDSSLLFDDESDRCSIVSGNELDSATETISSNQTAYSDLRLLEEISPSSTCSFVKIKSNGKIKYLHKRSAVWLLTDQRNTLSSEPLLHVIQAARKEEWTWSELFLNICRLVDR